MGKRRGGEAQLRGEGMGEWVLMMGEHLLLSPMLLLQQHREGSILEGTPAQVFSLNLLLL